MSSPELPSLEMSSHLRVVEGSSVIAQFPMIPDMPDVRTSLELAEAPDHLMDRVIGPDGEWKLYGEDDIPNLYDTPWFDVRRKVRERLAPVYDLVDYNLRFDKFPDGYNGHGLEHIKPVSGNTEKLLRMAGYGDEVVRMGVLAAEGHDLGNIVVRKGHSFESAKIFEAVAPSVLQNPGQWESISKVMKYHDEKALTAKMKKWGNSSAAEDVAKLREYGPLLAALVIADKTDVGRHRTNQWATNLETMERDDHAFVNFFGKSGGFRLEGDVLTWEVGFDPTVTEDEINKYGVLTRKRSHHEGYAARVPDWLHDLYRQGVTTHFDGWSNKFMQIYKDRMELTAKSTFALFPNIRKFNIEMQDLGTVFNGEPERSKAESYTLSNLDGVLATKDTIYMQKEKRRPDDYEETTE